ncbi:MAG: alpha/beta hydrolase [Desulforegulaceae bacterium]|nr:alpha/beta hydrolase [Desulforegulaceae bacterium]
MIFLRKTVAFFIIVLILSGCSKAKVYDSSIERLRKNSDLEVETIKLANGEISYLNNFGFKDPESNQDYLIMIHGFGSNKDTWLNFSKELTKKFKIIVLDLPGHGESFSELSNEYTIKNQVEWLKDFLTSLEIEKAHLIGSSMGGAIALKFTSKYPLKVNSLTLINSAGIYKTETKFTKSLEKGKNLLVVENKKEFKELMDLVMENQPYIPSMFFKVLTERKIKRKAIDQKIFDDMSKDLIDLSGNVEKIKTPTLILWGEKDQVLHLDNAYEFKNRIKTSSLVVFEDTGHLPMMEVPKKTASAFVGFVSGSSIGN